MAELNELLAALSNKEVGTYLKVKRGEAETLTTEIRWMQSQINMRVSQRNKVEDEINAADEELRQRRRKAAP